jgi:hypothetical protein
MVTHVERHDQALLDTIDRVTTRLRRPATRRPPDPAPINLERGIELARRAADTVERGAAGHMLLTATKP